MFYADNGTVVQEQNTYYIEEIVVENPKYLPDTSCYQMGNDRWFVCKCLIWNAYFCQFSSYQSHIETYFFIRVCWQQEKNI